MMFDDSPLLLEPDALDQEEVRRRLTAIGFADWERAHRRLLDLCTDDASRKELSGCLPLLLIALSEAATPDGSLINFERFVQSVDDRRELFCWLSSNPRAVEILIRLFVGSQFLTEILLRNPEYLQKLTNHKRLAEFKSRQEFFAEACESASACGAISERMDALRRYQHWELLRIGACDSFGLLDLKSVTVQLSLLADSLVQTCLVFLADELDVPMKGFAVLAFGKLGGEELNYSSDIDLVFLADENATRFWTLGQRLIKALMESTGEGFLYRVDMRLRPWGRSGALVNTVDAHIKYLQEHGRAWEKQALLKARVIAGDTLTGQQFLERAEPLIFSQPQEAVRENIREMKQRIEDDLSRQGRNWGEVKSGTGSIRDVEFITQYLQLAHGGNNRHVRSFNTLDGLVRLTDFDYLQANEYRCLSSGYVFLRTIEHSLQLMHHKQTHSMPEDPRELAYLARRLDYPDPAQFLEHYRRHCEAIRRIYRKYLDGEGGEETAIASIPEDPVQEHLARMEPSYSSAFSQEEIEHHASLLAELTDERVVAVTARESNDGLWRVTIVGLDEPGALSLMCGLLFVYGFNIERGLVFTADELSIRQSLAQQKEFHSSIDKARKFVDVFHVRPPLELVLDEVWKRYEKDLTELTLMSRNGRGRAAQGKLAKRVAGALRDVPEASASLYPVEIDIDNEASATATVLHIRAEDTIGFLYEFSNALTMAGINIIRVIVSSIGNYVFDSLYVTDTSGEKITDAARLRELRATIVLIKHFTHLLPRSPNPAGALAHFRDFLEQQFQQPNWFEELRSLSQPDVLNALARLLGVSDFLWEDFLRLQHTNLFPVLTDMDSLQRSKSREDLVAELTAELERSENADEARDLLNAFKDREMFRVDMRHIMGHVSEFGQFSRELTDVSEVVVAAAGEICERTLQERHGIPRRIDEESETPGDPCRLSICALGKCGGRELGYASDIELMFIYDENGRTDGPEPITASEYYQRLVEAFRHTIHAREEGIFQIDLRLRPYGRAGSLAVSRDAFRQYFSVGGPAWPYERQALVKLRPIAGDEEFGREVVELRDSLIYTGAPFDVAAMSAMREKQERQLVQAGTLNAKLSPGGLVDCEYLVQGLQITHGHRDSSLRATNTRAAMAALESHGLLLTEDRAELEEAYIFLRRLIDALRMVRGHARDLTVPPPDSEEFEYLARRLGYGANLARLQGDLELYTESVQDLGRLLEQPAGK